KNINKKINMLENKIKMYKSLVNQQIQNLQELKLTLISDVVTGKIDIREIEIPEKYRKEPI
ncbi:restriction endonuclease subunit S, partial [Gemella sp. zg-1178]|nr:restriction endonuclease subunit S [Gemella sp. zg-1178]